jgi:phosphoesterase RecJ-like protein
MSPTTLTNFQDLVQHIRSSQKILLSTHRQCDGDGLGAELGMFWALKGLGKNVRVINIDETPQKYNFLEPAKHIQYFDQDQNVPADFDLFLIFDTNDERLLSPLYEVAASRCKVVAFVDHHPVLKQGPKPTVQSWINVKAASTGEMSFDLIRALGIPLTWEIARALYTSITFDTQLFRYIRNSPRSHEIAAELLRLEINPQEIHRHLFGNQTVNKMAFLAKALGQIEYFADGRAALIKIRDADLFHYGLDPDDSRDVVDFVMNIESLEAAVLFREDSPTSYKMSLRSKGKIEVLEVAELLGGGGHVFAAGALVHGNFEEMRDQVMEFLEKRIRALDPE